MSFVSWPYPFFLAAAVLSYWALPLRGRLWLLMLSSYAFYAAWDMRFLALLSTSTALDYFCGRALAGDRRPSWHVALASSLPALWLGLCSGLTTPLAPWMSIRPIESWVIGLAALLPPVFTLAYSLCWKFAGPQRQRAFLLLSIGSNLAVLGFFKYAHFFGESLDALLMSLGWGTALRLGTVILPIAISFYTFQSISYAVDIYRGKAEPARDYVLFAAYLAFFPQLIAGPIERVSRFLPQFETARVWRLDHLHQGLRLLFTGVFKKVVIADPCALVANHAFDPTSALDGPWALLGAVAFAFQIYGDFSGYTDMARGSARLLGIELSTNFQFPYQARGPAEFWQRWHQTLSSWFRDYVYIPLGGNRCGRWKELRNLWITMALAGLWHGASWNFLLWGLYHAALLTLYRVFRPLSALESSRGGLSGAFAMALMFCWTLLGWVLFRCTSLEALGHWVQALGHWSESGVLGALRPAAWVALHVLPLLLLQAATQGRNDESDTGHWAWPVRGVTYALATLAIVASASQDQEFIYFQF